MSSRKCKYSQTPGTARKYRECMSRIGKVQYLKYYVRGNEDDVSRTRSGIISTLLDIRWILSDIGERQLGSQYQNNLKVTLHSYLNNTLPTLHLASGLSGYPVGWVKIMFSQHIRIEVTVGLWSVPATLHGNSSILSYRCRWLEIVGKQAGRGKNRAREGRAGRQMGKQTSGANGTGTGSRRWQLPALLMGLGHKHLKLIYFYFIQLLQLSINILV